MEYLVAVIAFAGAVLAAVATGVLIRRLRSEPEGWLIAWSVAAAALFLSLAVVGIGALVGFGTLTFRLYQLTGSLLTPIWLALGLIQLLATKVPVKFVTWLFGIAFTIVGAAILVFDPVGEAKSLSKALPSGGVHWDVIPTAVLMAAHVVVVLIMLSSIVVAGLRWRDGDDLDTDNLHAALVIAPTGIALVGAVRFAVPGIFTVALLVVTAAAIWYAVLRPLAPYEDEEDEIVDNQWEQSSAGRRAMPEQVPARAEAPAQLQPRRSGLGDLVAEYRAGDQDVDYAARMAPADPFDSGPATGYVIGDAPDPYGSDRRSDPRYASDPRGAYGADPRQHDPYGSTADPRQHDPYGSTADQRHYDPYGQGGPPTGPHAGPQSGPHALPPQTGTFAAPGHAAPQTGPFGTQQAYGMPGRESDYGTPTRERGMPAREPEYGMPATGAVYPGAELSGYGQPAASAQSSRVSPNIYGLLTVFTIMDGSGDAFDRLAEETVDAVRRNEPDTLVYVCHSVKSAPLQRIVYELYRDEVAYTDHQRQPHVERFITERQNTVLATNVIELNVNAAKVMPLPSAFR